MLGRDIQGRIYISAQGINAQYSGLQRDALEYAHWVSQQPGFEACFCQFPSIGNLDSIADFCWISLVQPLVRSLALRLLRLHVL